MGVYDADGGLLGELAYLTGRILGIAHCALCDITLNHLQGWLQETPGPAAALESRARAIAMGAMD